MDRLAIQGVALWTHLSLSHPEGADDELKQYAALLE